MGDELGDEWWLNDANADSADEAQTEEKESTGEQMSEPAKSVKRKSVAEKTGKAAKKKKQQTECVISAKKEAEDKKSTDPKKKRRRKKKTITDVLSTSEPKPGSAADLQAALTLYLSDKRSVIEQEELKLPDSCFLSANDMTHTLASYLKQVCPKWAKVQKQHTEKSSVALLIVCSSALRTIELIKQLIAFKGSAKTIKLFAKHIKIEEQVKQLQKGVTHIGVGTPGRISALIDRDGLNLKALRYLVLDWNWRDQKLRRMVDIPEIKLDFMKLLDNSIIKSCREDNVKIGLF